MDPWVGEPSDDHRATCSYAPIPGAPRCELAATTHLAVESDLWPELVALATCEEHRRIAEHAGRVFGVHPHRMFCGMPGTVWDEQNKRCALDGTGQSAGQHANIAAR